MGGEEAKGATMIRDHHVCIKQWKDKSGLLVPLGSVHTYPSHTRAKELLSLK